MKNIILGAFIAVFCITPALAQKKAGKAQSETPITQWIDAENALLETLPNQNQKVFFVLRNKHSVIRSINMVHRDVKNAVKACGKENPSIKSQINERLDDWEAAIMPILDEANDVLKRELKEQEAFYMSDYKHVMKLNDKAYEFSESKIQKSPVTTMKACEGLVKSMNRTEDHLVDLLQEILLPEEVVRKRLERAQK